MRIFLDGLILLILVLFVLRGAYRGFIKSVVGFVGVLASSFLATYLGRLLAGGIYASFFKQSILNSITNSIDLSVGQSVAEIIDKITSELPILKTLVPWLGQSESVEGAIQSASLTAANAVEGVIAPAIIGLISIILTSCLFVLMMCVVHFITRRLTGIARQSVLNVPNRFMGGALGLLSGVIFIMLAVEIIKIAASFGIGDNIFSDDTISRTILFKLFYSHNIFEFIFSSLLSSLSAAASAAGVY